MKRIVPENYQQARDMADASRNRAYAILDENRLREAAHRAYLRSLLRKKWWQLWRPAEFPLSIPFEKAVEIRTANDPRWKTAVSDNQWFVQYATMYAQGEELVQLIRLVDVTQQNAPILRRIFEATQRNDLRQVLAARYPE